MLVPNKEFFLSVIQFLKFSLVGLSNTVLSIVVYWLFVRLGVHYIAANSFAFALGVLNSFFWNNRFVFKPKIGDKRSFFYILLKVFISYGVTSLLLHNVILYLLVECFMVDAYFAQVICVSIVMPLNFLLNKFWSFKSKKEVRDK